MTLWIQMGPNRSVWVYLRVQSHEGEGQSLRRVAGGDLRASLTHILRPNDRNLGRKFGGSRLTG